MAAGTNVLFKVSVGASVPGGPFKKDEVYKGVGQDTLNHWIVKDAIRKGDVIILGDATSVKGGEVDALKAEVAKLNGELREAEETIKKLKAKKAKED